QEVEALNRKAQDLLLTIEEQARRRAWDRVKEGLGFGAAVLFLSCLAGVASAFIPAWELSALLSLFGIAEYHFGRSVLAIDWVFIVGFFVVLWFSEDGPPRPGRGILKGDAPKLIGACVFNFFFIAGLAVAAVYLVCG